MSLGGFAVVERTNLHGYVKDRALIVDELELPSPGRYAFKLMHRRDPQDCLPWIGGSKSDSQVQKTASNFEKDVLRRANLCRLQ